MYPYVKSPDNPNLQSLNTHHIHLYPYYVPVPMATSRKLFLYIFVSYTVGAESQRSALLRSGAHLLRGHEVRVEKFGQMISIDYNNSG